MTAPGTSEIARRRNCGARWLRRLAIGGAGLILVFLLQAQLLALLARPLVRLERPIAADTVLILGGDNSEEIAARLLLESRAGAGQILVSTAPPDEWSAAGMLPDEMSSSRSKLERLGVPAGQIHELRLNGVDESLNHELAAWLSEHRQARCLVLCDEMRSRETRWRLDRTLSSSDRERVALQIVSHRKFCRLDWWKSEQGISAFVSGWLSLTLQLIRGDVTEEWRECQPTQFTMTR